MLSEDEKYLYTIVQKHGIEEDWRESGMNEKTSENVIGTKVGMEWGQNVNGKRREIERAWDENRNKKRKEWEQK